MMFEQGVAGSDVQGYLAHKKERLPRTLWWDHTQGPTVALWGEGVSHE